MKAPFRLGRKQKRAVLDAEGNEAVVFPKEKEKFAELYVEFLNERFWDYALEYENVIYFTTADAFYDQEPETIRALLGLEEIEQKFSCWKAGILKERYGNETHFNGKLIIWK